MDWSSFLYIAGILVASVILINANPAPQRAKRVKRSAELEDNLNLNNEPALVRVKRDEVEAPALERVKRHRRDLSEQLDEALQRVKRTKREASDQELIRVKREDSSDRNLIRVKRDEIPSSREKRETSEEELIRYKRFKREAADEPELKRYKRAKRDTSEQELKRYKREKRDISEQELKRYKREKRDTTEQELKRYKREKRDTNEQEQKRYKREKRDASEQELKRYKRDKRDLQAAGEHAQISGLKRQSKRNLAKRDHLRSKAKRMLTGKRSHGLSHVVKRVLEEHKNHQRKRANKNKREFISREKKDGHRFRKRSKDQRMKRSLGELKKLKRKINIKLRENKQ